MATTKTSNKKRRVEPQLRKSDHFDLDPDFSNDIKGIMSALHQIREKATKDGLKVKKTEMAEVSTPSRLTFVEMFKHGIVSSSELPLFLFG